MNNYRPISVLPVFSKIIEKIVSDQLLIHLDTNNILTSSQYGFRNGRSTEMALVNFTNDIAESFDKGKYVLAAFLDLSKAFDTVSHDILLAKLYYYGIRGSAWSWFADYLKNRKQCVRYNNSISTLKDIRCSVPQGSILGPI